MRKCEMLWKIRVLAVQELEASVDLKIISKLACNSLIIFENIYKLNFKIRKYNINITLIIKD
jgi:hypothetical protein